LQNSVHKTTILITFEWGLYLTFVLTAAGFLQQRTKKSHCRGFTEPRATESVTEVKNWVEKARRHW
jgi:hypothetical protein